jgi:hypothetical protein
VQGSAVGSESVFYHFSCPLLLALSFFLEDGDFIVCFVPYRNSSSSTKTREPAPPVDNRFEPPINRSQQDEKFKICSYGSNRFMCFRTFSNDAGSASTVVEQTWEAESRPY